MAFMLYSGATSLTAPELAAKLKINCGRRLPTIPPDVIINYGAGSYIVPLKTKRFINHPKYIVNKLGMLDLLNKDIPIPSFCRAADVKKHLESGKIKYPIIGRTMMHQAGSGFFLCLSDQVVDYALRAGAAYFQQWENILQEYRVHVFQGKPIGAYKKVIRNNPKEEFCNLIIKEIYDDDFNLSPDDIRLVLQKALRHFSLPDFNIRSLHRGWRFTYVEDPPQDIINVAIKATNKSGLDFGAVDMMLTQDGAKFIELNTGPGLEVNGTMFNSYVSNFAKIITELPKERTKTLLKAKLRKKGRA